MSVVITKTKGNMDNDIEQRIRQAHFTAQGALLKARSVTGEALVLFANVGRLIDESGYSPQQIAAIDPEIERSRMHYHSAKRYVASHPDQLEMPALKLLLPAPDPNATAKPAPARDEIVELHRVGANLCVQLERVRKEFPTLADHQAFAVKSLLKRIVALCKHQGVEL